MSDGNLLSCDRVFCVRFATDGAFLSDRWVLLNPVAIIGNTEPGDRGDGGDSAPQDGGRILRIQAMFDRGRRPAGPYQ